MIIDLTSRRAIVTGSTAGIGRAIAEGLARAGAAVVISGRGRERVDAAVREMRTAFPSADIRGIAADIGSAAGADRFASEAPEADILVNSLGMAVPRAFLDTSDQDWRDIFEVNVMSAIRMARHYLRGMLERDWGRMLFLSSESALNIPKDMVDYGVTKTALLGVSRGLAEIAAGTGVTVNTVLPGPTRSEAAHHWMAERAREKDVTLDEAERQFIASERPSSLIGRFAGTEEVANMVVYLCSQQASATTGAALRVDSGVVRTIV